MQVNFEVFHLQLNATSLECVSHDVAVNEFRKAEESVWLLLEKNAEAQLLVSFPSSIRSNYYSTSAGIVICGGGGLSYVLLLNFFYKDNFENVKTGAKKPYW